MMKKLPRYSDCFICGKENHAGTDVTFTVSGDGVECEYVTDKKHIGYKDVLHGGVIAALLDECMGWAVSVHKKAMCVTGELTIRYKALLPVNTLVIVKGFVSSRQDERGEYCRGYGHIEDQSGKIYAKARGLFFPLPEESQADIFEILEYVDTPDKKVIPEELWGN